MSVETARIAALYRYPVKGFTPERLIAETVMPHRPMPGDRRFAIEFRDSGLDANVPEFRKKSFFVQLALFPQTARLSTRYDATNQSLRLIVGDEVLVDAPVGSAEGREEIENAIASFFGDNLPRRPRLIDGGSVQFTDRPKPHISVINLATVTAIGNAMGAQLDPLRFRGNIYVDWLAAWAENDLVGKRLRFGPDVVVNVAERIERCAATEVDPATGERDQPVVDALRSSFGHADCGILVEIDKGGTLRAGHGLQILDKNPFTLP